MSIDSTLPPHQLPVLLKSKTVLSSKSEQEDLNSMEMKENILTLSFKVLIASHRIRHIGNIPCKLFILGANQ